MARCKRETIAQDARAAKQAESICKSKWHMVTRSTPMANVLLALAPALGARFDAAAAKGKLTTVRWRAKSNKGHVATVKLGDVDVGVTSAPSQGVNFIWYKDGETIPFELPEALKTRGAALTMIACLDLGASEGGRVYRVDTAGKAPFALTINFREAAVAGQSSNFAATDAYLRSRACGAMALNGQPPARNSAGSCRCNLRR